MIAHIVKRLAGAVLVMGVVAALFLPERELTFCARWTFLECGSDPESYMRWGLVGAAALISLFVFSITWAATKFRL